MKSWKKYGKKSNLIEEKKMNKRKRNETEKVVVMFYAEKDGE